MLINITLICLFAADLFIGSVQVSYALTAYTVILVAFSIGDKRPQWARYRIQRIATICVQTIRIESVLFYVLLLAVFRHLSPPLLLKPCRLQLSNGGVTAAVSSRCNSRSLWWSYVPVNSDPNYDLAATPVARFCFFSRHCVRSA